MVDQNRDLQFTGGKDLRLTSTPEEYLSNFIAVNVGDALRRLVGDPQSGAVYEAARSQIQEVLQENDQIGFVLNVDIREINTNTGTVTISVVVQENTDFELEIEV